MEIDTKVDIEPASEVNSEKSRLGECEVCGFHDAKYTCPRCEVKTCSLRCNKIHKVEVECNGSRDRTKFISINKFSNIDLSSDYRLLEEISKKIEVSKEKYGKRSKISNYIPHSLIKLKNACTSRNTTLKYLPNEFARHRNNTTKFNSGKNKIFWHVDWVFVNANNLKLSDGNVDEDLKLSSLLNKYLVKQEDPILQEKLQYYQSADLPGINVYLKAEQKAGKKFYDLDATMTLKECLQKKLIIEYPTIHLVLKGHEGLYDIIDSDDELDKKMDSMQIKTGTEIVNRIINNAEEEESFYKSLKNLLFVSEYSDEDLSGED